VNVGARVGDLNKTYPEHDILLTEFTWQSLGPRARQYSFADLGKIEIRGKSQPVGVLGLVGHVAVES
jgi:class 3 adenylate cyclase